MGNVYGGLLNTFKSKIPEERVTAITNGIFDRLMEDAKKRNQEERTHATAPLAPAAEAPSLEEDATPASAEIPSPPVKEKTGLSFGDLHSAVVQVFEEVNKRIPGANCQAPSREKVEEILKQYDDNQDGHIDRDEFRKFVQKFTADFVGLYAKDVLVMTVAVPSVALMTKAATQRVPVVGSLFARIPNTIFAFGAASAALTIRKLYK